MSSEKAANGFIIAENFHVCALPEDPIQAPTWYVVDLIAQIRPRTSVGGEEAQAGNAAVLRPCVFDARRGKSDTSDSFPNTQGAESSDAGNRINPI
jgi:hypothetical protein